MISSAKTLFLATLVFNAATVFGAPIRNVDTSSESVARAEMSTPVQPVARAAIVDVEDNRRRSRLGHITRRSARLVSERDVPLPDTVIEPKPVAEVDAPIGVGKKRRYPRRALHDRHEKPKPAVPAPVVETRERRYPRGILHDRHEKREPATTIKETTKIVDKVTVLDTPEDALAFNANRPSASSTVSTLVSSSTTTTLVSDSSVPTATPTGSVSATDSVSASSTASSASATASSDASSTTGSVSATATPTASSTTDSVSATATPTGSSTDSVSVTATPTASATDSTITASPTSTAASGDPTVSASSTSSADGAGATPAASGDPTPSPAAAGGAPVRRGIYIRASTEPILRRVAFSGASWASSIKRQLNTH